MTFEEAIIESIRQYYKGNAFQESNSVSPIKYDKKYFDNMEENMLGKKKAIK